jgi:hypothetical protein
MVSTVKTDRTRNHVSTRGLEGRSSEGEMIADASLYMIGWRAGPCYVILQEGGFLPMSELNKLLLLEFQMSTHIVGIQREILFMIILIGLDGVREV